MLVAHGASRSLLPPRGPVATSCLAVYSDTQTNVSHARSVAKQSKPPTHANTRTYRTRMTCSATIWLSARFRCGSCHTRVTGTWYPCISCTCGSSRYPGTWLYTAGILRIGTRGLHQVYEYSCKFLVRFFTYLAKSGCSPPMTQNRLAPQLTY